MGNQRDQVLAPLAVAQRFGMVDVRARVSGGGMTGQAEAVRLALAKALATYENGLGHVLSLGKNGGNVGCSGTADCRPESGREKEAGTYQGKKTAAVGEAISGFIAVFVAMG